VPPSLVDCPEVSVSQKLFDTVPGFNPIRPPTLLIPFTSPIEYDLIVVPSFNPTKPPTLLILIQHVT
jgi:hypothetical protein